MDVPMELQIDKTPNSLVTKKTVLVQIPLLPWQLNLLSAFVSWVQL